MAHALGKKLNKRVSFQWFFERVQSFRWWRMTAWIFRQQQKACGNEGLCGCSWLKVVLLLHPDMGGGLKAQRCRVSTTRLEGHGGLEIMKGKPHSLPWFSLWPIMRTLDIREHITTTYLAAWQIDLGAWWVIDMGSSQHPNMCVYGWGRCQKYRSVRVSETEKYNDKFAGNKMEIQSKLSSSRDLNLHLYRFSTSKTTLQTIPPSVDDYLNSINSSDLCPKFIRGCPETSLF